jgi:hypothetical protein
MRWGETRQDEVRLERAVLDEAQPSVRPAQASGGS